MTALFAQQRAGTGLLGIFDHTRIACLACCNGVATPPPSLRETAASSKKKKGLQNNVQASVSVNHSISINIRAHNFCLDLTVVTHRPLLSLQDDAQQQPIRGGGGG